MKKGQVLLCIDATNQLEYLNNKLVKDRIYTFEGICIITGGMYLQEHYELDPMFRLRISHKPERFRIIEEAPAKIELETLLEEPLSV